MRRPTLPSTRTSVACPTCSASRPISSSRFSANTDLNGLAFYIHRLLGIADAPPHVALHAHLRGVPHLQRVAPDIFQQVLREYRSEWPCLLHPPSPRDSRCAAPRCPPRAPPWRAPPAARRARYLPAGSPRIPI